MMDQEDEGGGPVDRLALARDGAEKFCFPGGSTFLMLSKFVCLFV